MTKNIYYKYPCENEAIFHKLVVLRHPTLLGGAARGEAGGPCSSRYPTVNIHSASGVSWLRASLPLCKTKAMGKGFYELQIYVEEIECGSPPPLFASWLSILQVDKYRDG